MDILALKELFHVLLSDLICYWSFLLHWDNLQILPFQQSQLGSENSKNNKNWAFGKKAKELVTLLALHEEKKPKRSGGTLVTTKEKGEKKKKQHTSCVVFSSHGGSKTKIRQVY